MTGVKQVEVALHGKCNGGESHIDEKGCVLDVFCMWLISTGITNLLSLPMLKCDGYVCQYHTNSLWIVECPDGNVLKFKRNNGLCKGFPKDASRRVVQNGLPADDMRHKGALTQRGG